MDIRKTILTLCAVLSAVAARAQFDTHFTHYWALQGYYNPASAGLSGRLNLYGTYAMQMAGYTNAPATMLIGADMVLPTEKKNHAVSANLYNESIGLFTNQRLFAGYAYRFKLWGGRMAVGVNMGSLEQKFDGSKVEAEESADAAFPSSEIDGTGFDLTAVRGTYTYDEKRYYAGLTYSPMTSVAILLGGEINSMSFGYAYELFTSGVGAIHGSHDLYVGYVMDLDLFKKGRNKHKSIRIL